MPSSRPSAFSRWPLFVAVCLLSAVLPACDDPPPPDPPPAEDAGPADVGDTSDVWAPPPFDAGHECEYYSKPECDPANVPPSVPYRTGDGCLSDADCPATTTCKLGDNRCYDAQDCKLPWECRECPLRPDIQCPPPLVPLPDRYGCISGESECGCTFDQPPSCSPGLFAQIVCSTDGRRCYTGVCVNTECPCVPEPDCPLNEEPEIDADGCKTGACAPPPCAPVDIPECACLERAKRSPSGCHLGVCETEPIPCPSIEVPDCSNGQVPRLNDVTGCLSGECVPGFCSNRCQGEQDCATSDDCLPYGPNCNTCQPRRCTSDLECPRRTDCVGGRCRTRPTATCLNDDDCGEQLSCDDPLCGKCAPPCECREHSECPEGTRCNDCRCEEGCRNDGDCGDGLRCDPASGQCQECRCQRDDQCETDRYCDGCFCEVGCRDDTDCGPWDVCSPVNHRCEDAAHCARTSDCGLGRLCIDARCVTHLGICDGGATVCTAQWNPRISTYECRLDTSPAPDCREGTADVCEPGEEDIPLLCACDFNDCGPVRCGGWLNPPGSSCPAGPYHCSKADPTDPRTSGVCLQGRPELRRLCRESADCVPEPCCDPQVATFCVSSLVDECLSNVQCDDAAREGRPVIPADGCSCVEGVCMTAYETP